VYKLELTLALLSHLIPCVTAPLIGLGTQTLHTKFGRHALVGPWLA